MSHNPPGGYYEKVGSDHETENETQPLNSGSSNAVTKATAVQHQLKVLAACTTYALVGPTLVLVNARILNELHFPFPLFLSSLGQVVTSFYCAGVIHLQPRVERLWRRWTKPRAATAPKLGIEPVPIPSPKASGGGEAADGGGGGGVTGGEGGATGSSIGGG